MLESIRTYALYHCRVQFAMVVNSKLSERRAEMGKMKDGRKVGDATSGTRACSQISVYYSSQLAFTTSSTSHAIVPDSKPRH